jgi:hypothetical protein
VLYLIVKAVISGIIIVAAAKVAERSALCGAFIVSLPLVSILFGFGGILRTVKGSPHSLKVPFGWRYRLSRCSSFFRSC